MSPDVDTMRANRRREMDRMGRKRRQLARLRGESTSLVPAQPIRRRLNTLHDLGWSFDAIAAMHGAGTSTALNLIASGVSSRCERKFEPIATMPVTLHVPESVADNMWVPTLGATRRVRALLALGWRHEDITEFIGRSSHSIAGATYLRTRAIDWRVVDAAYERMSSGRGPSRRTAMRAIARGYAVPFAWNDIDDPSETPRGTDPECEGIDHVVVQRILGGERVRANTAERREVCRRWVASGRSLSDLERLTGWNVGRYFKVGEDAA